MLETPPPVIPNTTPTTFVMASAITTCCVTYNVTAPPGPWGLILLNYTGSIVPSVYDSSYRATVNGVPVLFGTTPEMYDWTVLKDLTEYSSLFRATAVFSFTLGIATLGGHFVTSLSLSFYPVPDGFSPPVTPTQIVPLWSFATVSASSRQASVSGTVPINVANATLELYAYGFSGSGIDEFWYGGFPAYRAIEVTVDGAPFATVQPFEYVNTGGLDLFLWDPVTGAFTSNDPPYHVESTAALGLIEGSHTFNATIVGLGSGSHWLVGGSLLLYTNSSVTGATLLPSPTPSQSYSNGTIANGRTENVSLSYQFASTIHRSSGDERAVSWTNETFRGRFTSSGTSSGFNSTADSTADVAANCQLQERLSSGAGKAWVNESSRPSLQFASHQAFAETSTTGGGYPITGNLTYRMLSFHQNWNSRGLDTERPVVGIASLTGAYGNDNVSATGSYASQEKLTSPAAGQLLQVYWAWSNTTKVFRMFQVASALTASFDRTLVSRFTPANLAAGRANVTANVLSLIDTAQVRLALPVTDAGMSNTATVSTLGAGGPFTFRWLGVPNLCSNADVHFPRLTCTSGTSGTYFVSVIATGVFGDIAISPAASWTVLPAPVAALKESLLAIDLGQSVLLNVTLSGGLSPFQCVWSANGAPINPPGACPSNFNFTPSAVGDYSIWVNATDGLGSLLKAGPMQLQVGDVPSVIILIVNTNQQPRLQVGTSIALTARVSGGVPTFHFVWQANGVAVTSGVVGGNLTFTPTKVGNVTVVVVLTDGAGLTTKSGGLQIEVTPRSGEINPNGSGSGSGSGPGLSSSTATLIGVGLAVALVAVLTLVLVRRRKPREPSSEPGNMP